MVDLEKAVSDNRFTISVIFPLVGALGFLASAEGLLPAFLSFSPVFILFGTLVMRLPLVAGLGPVMDRKEFLGLGVLTLYTYLVEFVGLKTGWPYGEFEYLVSLGPHFFGVPVGLPLFFIPLALNAYLLSTLMDFRGMKRVLSGLVFVLMIDLVLDPAAVSLGIWSYSGGLFYGVPLSNFVGWILSGLVALTVLELSLDSGKVSERLSEVDFLLDDLVSFQFLWGVVNIYYGNFFPAMVVLTFVVLLWHLDRFNFAFEKNTLLKKFNDDYI